MLSADLRVTRALFVVSLPLGFLVGVSELLVGFTLALFLSEYGLIGKGTVPLAHFSFLANFSSTQTLLLAGALRVIFLFGNNLVASATFESFCTEMRAKVARLSLCAPASTFSSAELNHISSTLISRSGSLFSSFSQLGSSVVILGVLLGSLFEISAWLSLISGLGLASIALPMLISRDLFRKYSSRIYEGTAAFNLGIIRAVQNREFLLIVGKHLDEHSRLAKINRFIFRNCVKYIGGISFASSWPQMGGLLLLVSVVYFNQRHVFVSSSQLIPFAYLLARLSTTFSTAVAAIGSVQFSVGFFKELVGLVRQAELITALPAPSGSKELEQLKSLKVQNVSVGRKEILLRGISCELIPGDTLLIAGSSGKGKSTLVLSLIGLVPLKTGRVLWNDVSLEEIDATSLHKQIGYSGADPFLLDASIEENLLYGGNENAVSRSEIEEALRLANCDFVYADPQGIKRRLGQGGEGLSAGQKQRLSFARAMLRKPKLLILDEATANIDVETEELMLLGLKRGRPDLIIVAVSHRESMRRFANKHLSV